MTQNIHGVEIKRLTTNPDPRGYFRELIRVNDPFFAEGFAQWSHSLMARNVVKAWHLHYRQVDWWYVPLGEIDVVLFDLREDSPTYREKMEFHLGESAPGVVRIPPGVAHGLKVVSDSAHLFYITSQIYDPDDEGRHPFDSPLIPHAWGDPATLIVSDRDRQLHVPPYPAPAAGAARSRA
jgi:dTDP-4-dehydrorhamnose 3,5-epimerase